VTLTPEVNTVELEIRACFGRQSSRCRLGSDSDAGLACRRR